MKKLLKGIGFILALTVVVTFFTACVDVLPLQDVEIGSKQTEPLQGAEVEAEQTEPLEDGTDELLPLEAESLVEDELSDSSMDGLEKVKVLRVVDGDTIVVEGDVRVRLIGVDTPETVKPDSVVELYGKEASDFTKRMLEGIFVNLERDVSDVDQYGRALRYVYLEDGTLFNELLLKEGYGKVVTYPPDVKYAERFVAAQVEAREAGKGLWGLSEVEAALTKVYVSDSGEGLIRGNPNSMIYHMPDGEHYNEVTRPVYFMTEEAAISEGYRRSKN